MQLEIIRGIQTGLGDSILSQSIGRPLGQNNTREKIAKRYYWPWMCSNIANYIRTCNWCQRVKSVHLEKTHSKPKTVHAHNKIWSQIGKDLMSTLMEIEGYKHILTIISYFTKCFELIPLKTKLGEEVGIALLKLMTCCGFPNIIISDQGRYVCKLETIMMFAPTVIIIISFLWSGNVHCTEIVTNSFINFRLWIQQHC